MATLTNTKIKDTYDGLLKTENENVLPVSGVTLIEDGLGNASALSLGRANNGVTITGALVASGLTYPTTDGTVAGQAIVTDAAGNLSFATVTTDTPNLQEVTDVSPSSTTNTITAKEFIAKSNPAHLGVRVWQGNNYLSSNTGVGYNTLASITTGGGNTMIGGNAGSNITTGGANVAIGNENLSGTTTGSYNMALGTNALYHINGNYNTGIGNSSGKEYNNGVTIGDKTLGDENIYIGANTRSAAQDTDNEIVIGYGAIGNGSNTATYGNSSITDHYFDGNVRADFFYGDGSNLTNLPSSTTPTLDDVVTSAVGANESSIDIVVDGIHIGSKGNNVNTVVGRDAFRSWTGGIYNVAIGYNALENATSPNNNTAVGYLALQAGTSHSDSTAIGYSALAGILNSSNNVALGSEAGYKYGVGTIKTGATNCVYIGAKAWSDTQSTDNEIVIGAFAVGKGSNSATYGNSSINRHFFTSGKLRIASGSELEFGGTNVSINGNSTSNIMNFYVSSTLAMQITSSSVDIDSGALYVDRVSGNVGIGASPSSKLTVNGQIEASSDTTTPSGGNAYFYKSSAGAVVSGFNTIIETGGLGSRTERMRIDSSGNVTIRDGKKLILNRPDNAIDSEISTNSSGTLILNSRNGEGFDFQNGGTGAMSIDSSGNVGINKDPENFAQLEVKADTNGKAALLLDSNATTQDAYIQYEVGGSAGWEVGMKGSGSSYGYVFSYGDIGTASNEKMRITSGGQVLIGTQTAQSGAQGGGANILTLKSAGNNWGVGPSTSFGNFYVVNSSNVGVYLTSGATSWISLSDERQKDIIENIDNAIDKISNWRTVIGKYKNDDEGIRRSFLIAQDVLNTFPEAVDDSIEENYGVRYSDTIPVLVKAIQEQQEIINDLKARIETLENK